MRIYRDGRFSEKALAAFPVNKSTAGLYYQKKFGIVVQQITRDKKAPQPIVLYIFTIFQRYAPGRIIWRSREYDDLEECLIDGFGVAYHYAYHQVLP